LREAQRRASERARARRCGSTVRVLVEESRRVRERDPLRQRLGAARAWFGRSEGEAPGVDGGIYFTGDSRVGDFADVRLESMSPFDFVGRAVEPERRAL
jgi:tRNA A37 methylthiotransferase MiaB